MKLRKKKSRGRVELPGSRVKLHFKRHFLPPLIGLSVAVAFVGFFDSQLLSAHIEAHVQSRRPAAHKTLDKNVAPHLLINRINVDAPVTFETKSNSVVFVQDLQHGVVHYPNTAVPGQEGNVVIFGQSSDQWWAHGDYKFIFTQLNKLKIGDRVSINYKGVIYTYKVYDSGTASPADLSVLNQSSNHTLTLLTPTPIGSSANRLVIRATQFQPSVGNDFTSDKAATLPPGAINTLPGTGASLWHELGQIL